MSDKQIDHKAIQHKVSQQLHQAQLTHLYKRLPRLTEGQKQTLIREPERMQKLIDKLGVEAVQILMGEEPKGMQGKQEQIESKQPQIKGDSDGLQGNRNGE